MQVNVDVEEVKVTAVLVVVFGADENHQGRHVDPDVRTPVPEAVLDHVRDSDRHLSDAGHV